MHVLLKLFVCLFSRRWTAIVILYPVLVASCPLPSCRGSHCCHGNTCIFPASVLRLVSLWQVAQGSSVIQLHRGRRYCSLLPQSFYLIFILFLFTYYHKELLVSTSHVLFDVCGWLLEHELLLKSLLFSLSLEVTYEACDVVLPLAAAGNSVAPSGCDRRVAAAAVAESVCPRLCCEGELLPPLSLPFSLKNQLVVL